MTKSKSHRRAKGTKIKALGAVAATAAFALTSDVRAAEGEVCDEYEKYPYYSVCRTDPTGTSEWKPDDPRLITICAGRPVYYGVSSRGNIPCPLSYTDGCAFVDGHTIAEDLNIIVTVA